MRQFFLAIAIATSTGAMAQVTVTEAWVRGTVPAQTTTGAYMRIKSVDEVKLVSASSPAAKTVEIHEMAMKGGVMEMRALEALVLPAGKEVELKPGGMHVMLMGLAKPLKAGDKVPITLTVEAKGKVGTVEVVALVRPLGAKN